MAKKRYKGVALAAIKRRERILDKHNTENYYSDIEYIGRLCVSQSKKEWIETNMYACVAGVTFTRIMLGHIYMTRK